MPRIAATKRDDMLSETRQRLLDAAAEEFAARGFASANINQISTAAGFAKGTIYNYFSSKRELMLALVEQIGKKHSRFIIEAVRGEDGPVARLRRFFSAGYQFIEQNLAQSRVAINIVYGYDQEFKDHIYQSYLELFGVIDQEIVALGIEQGSFREIDTDFAMALLMSLYLGSCSQLDGDGKIWFNTEAVADFVMGGLLRASLPVDVME